MSDRSAQLELSVPTDSSALGGVRLQLAVEAADSGADLDVVEELVLAVSELTSNVIRHTDHTEMIVRLDKEPDAWVLAVSGADGIDELGGLSAPADPLQLGGRGLMIVRSVMDSVGLVDEGGHRWVSCRKNR